MGTRKRLARLLRRIANRLDPQRIGIYLTADEARYIKAMEDAG